MFLLSHSNFLCENFLDLCFYFVKLFLKLPFHCVPKCIPYVFCFLPCLVVVDINLFFFLSFCVCVCVCVCARSCGWSGYTVLCHTSTLTRVLLMINTLRVKVIRKIIYVWLVTLSILLICYCYGGSVINLFEVSLFSW